MFLKRGETVNDEGQVIKVEPTQNIKVAYKNFCLFMTAAFNGSKDSLVLRLDVKVVAEMFGFTDALSNDTLLELDQLKKQ